MRKEFKNAGAKHGLNKKNGIRAIGLSFLRDQKNVKERGEGEKKKKRKRKRRRREEKEKL